MNDRITIRVEADIVEALHRVMAEDMTDCRSRQDAFRYIVRDWLLGKGYLETPIKREASGGGA